MGDDSPYEDVWEEYAEQVQGQESTVFEMYQDIVQKACYDLVDSLTKPNIRRLWKESEGFFNWDDEEPEPDAADMEDVTKELFQRVNNAAVNYDFPWLDER